MTTRTRGAAAGRAALAGVLALGGPLLPAGLGAGAARADTLQASEACPAGARPHDVARLSLSFNDQGDDAGGNDTVEAVLTLCGKADLKKAAYEMSLDAVPPLFSDADRNGDGTVDRHDFCAQTRDAVSGLDAGASTGVGTATLVPGAGGAPDQVWFSVPVDAIAPDLPRDGRTRSTPGSRRARTRTRRRRRPRTWRTATWSTGCRCRTRRTAARCRRRRARR